MKRAILDVVLERVVIRPVGQDRHAEHGIDILWQKVAKREVNDS